MGTTKQALRYADNECPEQFENHERAMPAMMAPHPGASPPLTPFARVVAIVCIAFGTAGLASWWWGEPLFPGLLRSWGVLKPNTAFCFVLAGLSLAGLAAQSRLEAGVVANRFLLSLQPTAALLLLIFAGMTL